MVLAEFLRCVLDMRSTMSAVKIGHVADVVSLHDAILNIWIRRLFIAFWDVTPCNLKDTYQYFKWTCCLHPYVSLKMEAISFFEILIIIYWTMWHEIAENSNLCSHCHKNCKSHFVQGGGNAFVGHKLVWNGGGYKMFPFYNKCLWSEISAVVPALILSAIKCMLPSVAA